jgi:hypothetical protein
MELRGDMSNSLRINIFNYTYILTKDGKEIELNPIMVHNYITQLCFRKCQEPKTLEELYSVLVAL